MNLNKQTITYSFIIIFIIITFIHLYKINNKHNNNNNDNNDNDKENFADLMEDQNLQGFTVSINSMSQVLFGNTPSSKLSLKTLMDDKVSKTELNDKVSRNELNDAMPELSVISYAGSTVPNGWQLCDGEPLKYKDDNPNSLSRFVLDNTRNTIKTPDLRGRFILGANPVKIDGLTPNFNRNIRNINENGGEETHKLSKDEMPTHNHGDDTTSTHGAIYANLGYGAMGGLSSGGNWHLSAPSRHQHSFEGNDLAHNNMPPFYVLTYIIKQPSQPL